MNGARQQRQRQAADVRARQSKAIAPRVCILTETYHPIVGGGETQARLLAENLLDQGSAALVVTRRVDRRHPRRETAAAVEIHRLGPTGRGRLSKWGLLLTTLPGLVRLRHGYDLILVSGFRILGAPAVLAARLCGKRCVLKADSLGEMSGDYFAAGLARWRLRPSSLPVRLFLAWRNRLLRGADAFVAISAAVEDELLSSELSAERIRAIPNAVDTTRFQPLPSGERAALRQRLGIPFDQHIVVYTGRLVSYKGLHVLLRAWQEVRREHPRAGLLLVGAGGLDIHDCEAELKEHVTRHGLSGSVHFAGSVDNVEEFLQASDVFVFPTEKEAFGISLVEAMACGLPVVSTAVGGVKDIVEDEVNGLTIGVGSQSGLREALCKLLGDGERRDRLGAAARRTAERRYSAPAITKQYLELFADLVGATTATPVASA